MPIFVKAFDGILISELNRGRMKKFLENVFPAITATYFDQ